MYPDWPLSTDRSSCFHWLNPATYVGTGVDKYEVGSSGNDMFVQLVDANGRVSAETALANYFEVGDRTAAAGIVRPMNSGCLMS